MEKKRSNAYSRSKIILTAIFAVSFVWSLFATIGAVAAANLFKIQNAELSELSATAEGSITNFDESTIVSNVTFHKLNDSAKYTITLKNTDDKDHIIESITDDNENPYISYEYDQYANERINAGADLIFIVTAKYTTAVTDMSQRAQATDVKFMIRYTDIPEPETVSINPNTSDNIMMSVIILAISATGLIIYAIAASKRNKKLNKVAVVAIAAIAATTIAANVDAVKVEISSFTLTTNYGLYDKLAVTYTDKNGDEQELIVDYNEPAIIPDQNKDGYDFTGWEDEQGNPVDPTQPITEDIKIRPVYRAHTYTINFDKGADDATGSTAAMSMNYGDKKNLTTNSFARTGYTFAGWKLGETEYANGAEVQNLTAEDNGSVTFVAQWTPNNFTVIFNKNSEDDDVVGEMESQEFVYDTAEALNSNTYSRRYYKFKGWNTAADGTGTHFDDEKVVKNLAADGEVNLYAEWEELISILHAGQAFANRIWQVNPNIKQLIPYEGIPNLEGLNAVNVAVSGLPTYIWTDENDIVYYWSEAKARLNGNMNQSFCNMTTLEKVDFSGFDASMVTNWSVAFTYDSHLKEVIFGKIDFSNTTTMAGMFNGTAIESIDLSNVKTSTKLTSVSSMFANCTKLKNITIGTNFETSNVTSFSNMFYNTPLLETLDEENLKVTDKATNLSKMFQSSALPELNVDSWNTSNVTDMSYLFASTKFTEIDINHFNTSSVTDMSGLFQGSMLSTIDITNWDTSNVTGFGNMFKNVKVSSLDISNFDTSSATSFQDMFSNTSPLKNNLCIRKF